jgi:exopolysaccharide biosynthesis protein
MDAKQRDARAMRAALGYKDNKLYLIVSHNSTVSDLTAVCLAMGMDYALNLDGGYSTALFYNHEYVLGPGRDVVNALVFSQK